MTHRRKIYVLKENYFDRDVQGLVLWNRSLQSGPKSKPPRFVITSSNVDRSIFEILSLTHSANVCYKVLTKDPAAPQARRYTTLWNIIASFWIGPNNITLHYIRFFNVA